MEHNTSIRKSDWKPAVVPVSVAVGIWLFLHFLYEILGLIENVSLYRNLASINWILLVISVGFSALVVYPVVFFRGASKRICILAVFALPMAWSVKEFIRVSATVTIAESLFYVLFTPVQILVFVGQVGLIGVADIYCRIRLKQRKEISRVMGPVPLSAIFLSVLILYFVLIRGGGYDFHLAVKMIYRSLFL